MSTLPHPAPPKLIQLPRSSTRLAKTWAHIKLIKYVRPIQFNIAIEGPILAPGALVSAETLGPNPVVIECAGPVGVGERGKRREVLWILWRDDWSREAWIEVARAAAVNWEWTLALREPAIQALQSQPVMIDLLQRGRDLAGELMGVIEQRIEPEIAEIRINVLTSVYDQVAGRIATLA